jgi:predicted  nucleic acid-binding Zn-ribbon protein
MKENDQDEFKISVDEEIPESVLGKQPIRRSRATAARPKQRGFLMPFFLFIILGIGLAYGYVDIRHRILSIQNAGSQMTESIAGDLGSKFSNLSVKSAKLEDDLAHLNAELKEKVAAMEKQTITLQKAIDSLQTDSQKTRSSLDKLTVGRKPIEDKIAVQSKTIDNLQAAIDPLQRAAKANKSAYETEQKKLSAELAALRERTNVLSKAIGPLKAANEALSGQLALLEKTLKAQQAKSDRELNQSLDNLAAQLQTLKADLKIGDKTQRRSDPLKVGSTSPAPANPTAGKGHGAPKPGQFTEQDIQ